MHHLEDSMGEDVLGTFCVSHIYMKIFPLSTDLCQVMMHGG